ncbi:undecaprenyl-phosphate galactose phosphotransferase WbaP [Desulfovibrio legallii]|uniref:undecaprenyl-phosphate galactose phosphotransferase WbaP n=1 Tax=Desulfovibrio legallii TaxID=571438 RepID=UPI003A8EC6DA
MHHPPFWVRALRFCGFAPQNALLCLADLLALTGTALAVFLLRAAFGGVDPVLYQWVLPLLVVLGPLMAGGLGLYQRIGLPPHREVRALFQLDCLLYGCIVAALFLSKTGDVYSRIVLTGAWACSAFTLPWARSLCRRRFAHCWWWGSLLVIFDHGGGGREFWHYLKRHPERDLNPVDIRPLPSRLDELRALFSSTAIRHPEAIALFLQPAGQEQSVDYITEASRYFQRILVVPVFGDGFRVHWLSPRDLGQAVGLLVRQNLRDKRRLRFKRGMDLLFCTLGAVVLLPLGFLLALCIRLDSPGPIFFRQRRVGQGGREIRIFKFRTMVRDADAFLQRLLQENPALQEEWEKDQKLKNDPRITRVGRILRKLSLDELPQLIPVVKGDMSLVGPRPIVENEEEKYGPVYEEYCLVKPGITGLWQISGRNNTSYAERVAYDHYYISNWSVWMDLWILGKTVPVVLTGYGAY